jgi:hypothetical protein
VKFWKLNDEATWQVVQIYASLHQTGALQFDIADPIIANSSVADFSPYSLMITMQVVKAVTILMCKSTESPASQRQAIAP